MPTHTENHPPRRIAAPLLRWYDSVHGVRDLPWRKTRDPYAIWLSETMLQQTQVETVKPYYHRFLKRFPTVTALAAAPLDDVLTLWAGLGYYRRARHLHQAAQHVVAQHGGILPNQLEHLRRLPGIGRYTAGAVASIAFGQPTPVVDGNVMRVLSRLTGYKKDIAVPRHREFFWKTAAEILVDIPDHRYGDLNQALMELGATVCLPAPARPSCLFCPLQKFCKAFAEGEQMNLPVKSPRKSTPVVRATAVVIVRKNSSARREGTEEVLLMQRPLGGLWEQLWEFPVLPPTKLPITRQIQQALGLRVQRIKLCAPVEHQLTHRLMKYEVIRCELATSVDPSKLPACGKHPYVAARWLPWPFGSAPSLALAKIVHKIAASAR